MKKVINETQKAYIAGIIDVNGSIMAQIVKHESYKYHYEIRVSVVLYQKSIRHWANLEMQQEIGGEVRQRSKGMSELTITGSTPVKNLLEKILPYLRLKKRIAELVLEIIKDKERAVSKAIFLEVCKKVDKVSELTATKGRKTTYEVVKASIEKET